MVEATPLPLSMKLARVKLAWRVLLVSNLAFGAYLFMKPLKGESVEEKAKAESELIFNQQEQLPEPMSLSINMPLNQWSSGSQ
ncbi:hypothetical protein LIER_30337 [Lithospermum erythrorhizon]|uniref:Uncharacterized protein n=1 Tax=Lithospermum erythrorhizon TaxID=34254 RepID=A0AAV3RMB3_LITER